MPKQNRPAAEPIVTPHDPANDGQTPSDPANSGDAINTPEATETPELQSDLDSIVDAVAGNAPADGTVSVDFGKAGKLTGCLVLNHAPGADYAADQVLSVLVPTEAGYASIHVEGRYLTAA
jgi:hypothetical protein